MQNCSFSSLPADTVIQCFSRHLETRQRYSRTRCIFPGRSRVKNILQLSEYIARLNTLLPSIQYVIDINLNKGRLLELFSILQETH